MALNRDMRRLTLFLVLAASAAAANPTALHKEKDERLKALNACLWYATEAYDDGLDKEDVVARRIMFKCDATLVKAARVFSEGAVDERSETMRLAKQMRADMYPAITIVRQVRARRETDR